MLKVCHDNSIEFEGMKRSICEPFLSRTDFRGELTEYEYDDHNRLMNVYHEGMLKQEMI